MKYRILQAKLLSLHHIATLHGNSLAREMYEVVKEVFTTSYISVEEFIENKKLQTK